MHGLTVILTGRLLFTRLSFNALYVVAIATGVDWEIIEHTDFVIRQFRYGTVNQGYTGDSVLNAVSDYIRSGPSILDRFAAFLRCIGFRFHAAFCSSKPVSSLI